MRLGAAVSLALVLLVAGCVGDARGPSAAVGAPAAGPSPVPGGADAPADAAPEPAAGLPLHAEETLDASASACPPQARTHCLEPAGSAVFGLEDWLDGTLLRLEGEVAWEAESPLTEELQLWLGGCWGTPDAYECETYALVEGPSPLRAEAVPTRGDANYYFVVVAAAPASGAPVGVWASTEQPFVLDALVTWQPDAPPGGG